MFTKWGFLKSKARDMFTRCRLYKRFKTHHVHVACQGCNGSCFILKDNIGMTCASLITDIASDDCSFSRHLGIQFDGH